MHGSLETLVLQKNGGKVSESAMLMKITMRNPDNLDRRRANMTSQSVINGYFDTVETVLRDNDLMNQPDKILMKMLTNLGYAAS